MDTHPLTPLNPPAGKVPPPHLSPFINNEEEGYTPDFAATVARLQDAARAARLRAAGALLPEGGFLGDTEAEAGEAAAAAAEEDLEAVEKVSRCTVDAGLLGVVRWLDRRWCHALHEVCWLQGAQDAQEAGVG